MNHTGVFPSVTVSFNLAPGLSLSDATLEINEMQTRLGLPSTIRGFFAGTLQAYQQSLSTEPILVTTALLAVYIVLGILYESLVHPLTIISTLPPASVGAMLALLVFKNDLNVISIIGIVLLIGLVKKNAIMMIDFALVAEREHGKSTTDAIFEACMLRFRPIMMTTMAALFGAIPLAFGTGTGSELRRPLGITIVGGLIVSQMLTLYTTPVIYLYMDRLRLRAMGKHHDTFHGEPRRSGLERVSSMKKTTGTNRRSQVGLLLMRDADRLHGGPEISSARHPAASCLQRSAAAGPDLEPAASAADRRTGTQDNHDTKPGPWRNRPTRKSAATGGRSSTSPS